MTIADPEPLFWKNLIKGLEAEPLDPAPIKGISGVDHQVLGFGVDKARNRLILVLPEPHARSAAMAQVDIQAALGAKIHVVVARPVHINLTAAALELVSLAGGKDITSKKFTELPDESKSLIVQSISKVSKITNQAYPGMLPLIGRLLIKFHLLTSTLMQPVMMMYL